MAKKILVIDDEPRLRALLSRIIGLEGYEVYQANDCRDGLKQLESVSPDVVLCDVRLPDGSGVELIGEIKSRRPFTEIIMLTAFGNIPDGVRAIKNGAFDYLTKGDDNNRIIPLIAQALERAEANKRTREEAGQVGKTYSFDGIWGKSAAIRNAVDLARKVSATDVPVLLTGETGTGKEVFAQAIHRNSKRSNQAFVAVNCSSLSRELLESEMFGYRAGAFTGAAKDKKGLFEAADRGTIFLDEIGEMDITLQAKLLRVLESGEFIKVGDTRPVRTDVRIIAATNRDFRKEIEAGRFREDLFYRLSVFRIHLPPLRERPGDIELYARSYVTLFAGKMGKPVPEIDPAFTDLLRHYSWNGNVRELRNVIERSLIVASGNRLSVVDLPVEMQHRACPHTGKGSYTDFELAGIERMHIQRVLEYTGGNKTEAARLLKIGLTTLYRKIEEYGL